VASVYTFTKNARGGHGGETLRDVVMKSGAIDFLNKPVRSETLLKAIRAALAETGAIDASR
jgi:FixJ family two-component response regulator